jgi:hypothetical protein
MTFPDRQRVARNGNDAFDEIDVGALLRRPWAGLVAGVAYATGPAVDGAFGRMEHDDVAAIGIAKFVVHAIDQDSLADVERRLHGFARDAVWLDEKGLDEKRKPERRRNDQDELDDRS